MRSIPGCPITILLRPLKHFLRDDQVKEAIISGMLPQDNAGLQIPHPFYSLIHAPKYRYIFPFSCHAASFWSHHPPKFTSRPYRSLFGPIRGCSLRPLAPARTVLQRPGTQDRSPSFGSVASIVDCRRRFLRPCGRRTVSSTRSSGER